MLNNRVFSSGSAVPVAILGLAALVPLHGANTIPKRKALVIGNATYTALTPIPAAQAGAAAMAKALQSLDFEVLEKHDLSLTGFDQVIRKQFVPSLQPGEVCLIYYSGYALQSERTNYFVPVEFNPQVKDDAFSVAYSIDRLRDQLKTEQLAQKFFFLEASWDSPQLAQWTSGNIGLAPPTGTGADTVLLLDTGSDQTITQTSGGLGLFTAALVQALAPKPGLNLIEVIDAVQTQVSNASNRSQQPYAVGARIFEFISKPTPPPVPEPRPKPGALRVNPRDNLQYAWIPSGSFSMGCVPIDRNCAKDELPRHILSIAPGFWITNTEVTVSAYESFTRQTGHKQPNKTRTNPKLRYTEHPVTGVTWQDASDYCQWAGGRLPTEPEWEYAARAGKSNDIYPWGNKFDSKLCNSYKSEKLRAPFNETVPVRSFGFHNAWNLFDMIGNVREWVWDVYDPNADDNRSSRGPRTSQPGKERVLRGGSFGDGEKQLRLSARDHQDADKSDNQSGFRCVLSELPQ